MLPAEEAASRDAGAAIMAQNTAQGASPSVGVYIHFPWCIRKCPYCDFLSVPSARADIPQERYTDAVLAELAVRRAELGPSPLRSVFFGGGTPSLWNTAQLGRVLRGVLEAFPANGAATEITVECNPGSLGYDKARALLDAGVNRLSIGVQGLDDSRLRFLGRWHDAEQALESVRAAVRSGMPRVSADLIYGVAEESPETAAEEARRLVDLGLSHLSAYALTIEAQTAFGAAARKGRLPQAPEQAVADSFLAVDQALGALGLEHYETSNFARPGQRSEHNLGYWRGLDYVGLGCGAWGTLTCTEERLRYRNRPQPQGYMDTAIELGALLGTLLGQAGPGSQPGTGEASHSRLRALARQLESENEPLAPEVQLSEALMLGLRLAEGVDVEAAAIRTGASFWSPARRRSARRLIERGRLVEDGPRLFIPKAAWLFADGIISELL
jgi:putative oxygen-independent coproporphyrinogen III oxidase